MSCFVTSGTEERLDNERADRSARMNARASRQRERCLAKCSGAENDDAENQLQLISLILAQLARQENALLELPDGGDSISMKNREKLKLEAMEVLGTIL